jgi:hypothetical protein
MAKEKKSSGKSTMKKTKKSAAATAAAPQDPVAGEIAGKAPDTSPDLLSKPLRTAPPPPAQLYDEIRCRAYEFYCERGGEHGSHEADWHRAESEVRLKYK